MLAFSPHVNGICQWSTLRKTILYCANLPILAFIFIYIYVRKKVGFWVNILHSIAFKMDILPITQHYVDKNRFVRAPGAFICYRSKTTNTCMWLHWWLNMQMWQRPNWIRVSSICRRFFLAIQLFSASSVLYVKCGHGHVQSKHIRSEEWGKRDVGWIWMLRKLVRQEFSRIEPIQWIIQAIAFNFALNTTK